MRTSPTEPIDWTPTPKVSSAMFVGAIVVIVSWVSQVVFNFNLPTGLDGLITFVLTVVSAYLKKDTRSNLPKP